MTRGFPVFFTVLFLVLIAGCSKEETYIPLNPYENPLLRKPPDTTTEVKLEPGSFQYLYEYVFHPTCANSGCHDGNFEPDYRSIYSTYNTLVNHPVIKNNATNDFKYRVDPGNVATSVIIERLTHDIDGKSGIMPLSVDPDSDWPDKKETYIDMIRKWIEDGAPDSYGNYPGNANAKPTVAGIMAFHTGSTTNALARIENKPTNPIGIPQTTFDVWFSFSDDKTDPSDFKLTLMKVSYDLYDFENSTEYPLIKSGPLTGMDFWNNSTTYTHMATLSFPSDTIGTYLFIRTYLQDGEQADTSEVPNDGTSDIMRSYFTLKIDSL